MITPDKIRSHVDSMLEWGKQDLFLERRFTTAESWNKHSTEEGFRYRGIFRDREPNLQRILQHSRILILGEPGSGKSSIAKAAVYEVADKGDRIPVPALLKGYRGNLRKLLEENTPPELLDAQDLTRTYVLDGLDEVPSQFLDQFTKELSSLAQTDGAARFVITSRQAFHAKHPSALSIQCDVFHILDFGDPDVRKFAEARHVPSNEFLDAVNEADCQEEIRNPFILSVMVERYREQGQLSPFRSNNVGYMIDRLIATRPNVNAVKQRRALRMLGVACETYSRNELTDTEALRVLLEAIDMPEDEARRILDELSYSILVRTPNGIAFQMRSHGEYLAAEELAGQKLDRIKELAFFEADIPNDSWMNAISYLAELNDSVKRYFLRNHPEWMFSVSPAAFSEAERTALCSGFIDRLNRTGQLVIDQRIVRPRKLARLLTDEVLQQLKGKLESTNIEEAANALTLLGIREQKEIVQLAVKIVKQFERADPLRYAAIVALVNAGDHTLIDELISALKPDSPYYINLADCIGSLARPEDIPKVIPVLLAANAGLSAAYYRFREFRSKEFVVIVLKYLLEHPQDFQARRVDAYFEPAIEQIPDYWDEEVEDICAQIIIDLDRKHVYPSSYDLVGKFLQSIAQTKATDNFVRKVLSHFIETGQKPIFYADFLAQLITRDLAIWLRSAASTELIQQLAAAIADPEIRSILAPVSEGFIAAQDQYRRQYLEEQQSEAAQRKTEIDEKQAVIGSSDKFPEVVTQLHSLDQENWPGLPPDRLKWLGNLISEHLISFDLEHSITHSGTSWTSPSWLKPLLDIVGHYRLLLPDDSALVLALRSWPEDSIIQYYQNHGFTEKAKNLLKDMLPKMTNNPHVIRNLMSFLKSAHYSCDNLLPELEKIAKDKTADGYVRIDAVELIATVPNAVGLLEEFSLVKGDKGISDTAFSVLVEKQHRKTIERALSALLTDESALKAGEVGFPEVTPLSWIGKIHESFAWDKLVDLRAKTLALELPNLAQVVTGTLKRIDPNKLPAVVRKQIADAPQNWKRTQQIHAAEYEREARMMRALATPFDVVIAHLKDSTSMIALKVWCEGPNDRPVFRVLFQELGELDIARTLDYVGGWGNLVRESEPDRWLDGCRRAVIVMDGDNGRYLTKAKRPESRMAKEVRRSFGNRPIKLFVLQRYGIENYFPQTVCEKVLGRDLSAYFPVPEVIPIEHHFIERDSISNKLKMALQKMFRKTIGKTRRQFFFKNRHNELVAAQLTFADFAGTDLEEIIQAIITEAENSATN